jgi:hypothetical protein
MRYRKVCGFESHLGHSVSAGHRAVCSLGVDKSPKVLTAAYRFLRGQHSETHQKGRYRVLHGVLAGSKSRDQQGLTVATLVEAETLKRLLDANGQSFEIAQHAILTNATRAPTVAEVMQEHIDLLVRPSSGTTKTYQTMLISMCVVSSAMFRWTSSIIASSRQADAEVGVVDVADEPLHLGEGVHAFVPSLVFVGTGLEIGGERDGEMVFDRDPDSATCSCFNDGRQEGGDEVGVVGFAVEDEGVDSEVCGEIDALKDFVLGLSVDGEAAGSANCRCWQLPCLLHVLWESAGKRSLCSHRSKDHGHCRGLATRRP